VELAAIVAANVIGRTAFDPDRQRFLGELVNYGEHAELSVFTGSVLDEIIYPDISTISWPEPDAETVIQP